MNSQNNNKKTKTILKIDVISNKGQTEAQRKGTENNKRLAYLHRCKMVHHIKEIAIHNSSIKTKELIKHVNKRMLSRKQNGSKSYKITEQIIIRAIKEHADEFPKDFINNRKAEIDALIPLPVDGIHKKSFIHSFFNPIDDHNQNIDKNFQD